MKNILNQSFGLQEERSPISCGLYDLHEKLMYFLIIISIFVCFMIFYVIYSKHNILSFKYITHNVVLEIIWTFIPAVILILIAVPSFKMLYSLDEIINPVLTVKAIRSFL